jgi:hypothetical protein
MSVYPQISPQCSLAYETTLSMSTQGVSTRKWHFTLATLVFTICAGALLMLLLAAGYANPPYGQRVTLELEQPPESAYISGDIEFSEVGTLPTPPFTIEVSATFTTSAEWGIWLGNEPSLSTWRFLVDNDGYIAAGARNASQWQPFIHAQPETNRLYLHVSHRNLATFRVNEEIAWTGSLIIEQDVAWGLMSSAGIDVQWNSIRVYTD